MSLEHTDSAVSSEGSSSEAAPDGSRSEGTSDIFMGCVESDCRSGMGCIESDCRSGLKKHTYGVCKMVEEVKDERASINHNCGTSSIKVQKAAMMNEREHHDDNF